MLLTVSLGGNLCPADEAKRRFDIPAGAAVPSLNQWAAQADLYLIGSFEKIRDRGTRAVNGEFVPEDALRQMTAGTGIVCQFTRPRTMWCTLREEGAGIVALPPPPGIEVLREALPEVTITGTPSRGFSRPFTTAITIDREDIQHSGLATLAEVLRTLPQNFEGGPTEDTREIGRETRTNAGMGTAMNLRGLGPGETLVLLNGRRLAAGGSEGAFIDISSIPLSAVERIDILPDGGSVLHGADAIGGVIDVVLRRDYSGFETEGRAGIATQGGPAEYRFSQAMGLQRDRGHALFAFEYFQRDALPTARRAQAHSDLTAFGGDNFDVIQGNPGTLTTADGRTWAIPANQEGTSLTAEDFTAGTVNLEDRYRGADLLPLQRRWSFIASAQRPLNEKVSLFADVLFGRRHPRQQSPGVRADLVVPSSNPFYVNPTGGTEPVIVSYDFIDDLGPLVGDALVRTSNIAAGVDLDLPADWRLMTYVGHAREELDVHPRGRVNFPALFAALGERDPARAFNPFGQGSHTPPAVIDALRASASFASHYDLRSFQVAGEGSLLSVPGGPVKLMLGADARQQIFNSVTRAEDFDFRSRVDRRRDSAAAFGEGFLPVIGPQNRHRALHRLDLSLAARFEHDSDAGGDFMPKLGWLWSPVADLSLRGTWARLFKTPNLADLDESDNSSQIMRLPDSSSATGFTSALLWIGRNADLEPEKARNWTLGVEIAPQRLWGTSVALTYFNVRVEDQVAENLLTFDVLDNPERARMVIRAPTAAQRQKVCQRSRFAGSLADCLGAPIGALVDARPSNGLLLQTSGLDFKLRRETEQAFGRLELGVDGTYLLRYTRRETPHSRPRELLDTQNNPLRLRLRGTLSWQRAGLGATASLNYAGGYRDTASQPTRAVDSWTTCDLQLRYEVFAPSSNTRFSLNVRNLFDRDPPFLNNSLGLGYDAENADLMGRVASFSIDRQW